MTIQAHRTETATAIRQPRRGATGAAEWYRHNLGWPVDIAGGGVHLILTGGLAAFEVPAHLAGGVLRRLSDLGAVGPVLRTGTDNDRVAFLCDVDDIVFAQADMPLGVRCPRMGAALPLPSPRPSKSWLVAPDPDRRWLPSASAVLHAVRHTTAAAARAVSPGFPRATADRTRSRKDFG
ncbi:hypothetical protein Q5530_13180 [Saccharothrix sp. BKS2]|uniref:hypothetical protein n=1 Tax=Saccharothrix sp. BKS2 TaxID=3064400 RepID=UPI0039E923EB